MAVSKKGLGAVEVVANALQLHSPALRAFVRGRVPPAEVDDVLQLAALRAIERAASLDDPARVRAWLYRLHRNVIVDVARKRERHGRVVDQAASVPEQGMSPAEPTCGCSLHQVRTMRPGYAEILQLVDVGGFTLAEAAEALGVSTNNATVRLHRARKALRRRLKEHCGVVRARDCVSCRCNDDGCCAA